MGQSEVIELLNKKNKQWLTKTQIKELMGNQFCTQAVTESLNRLVRAGIIEKKPCDTLKRGNCYKIRADLVKKGK